MWSPVGRPTWHGKALKPCLKPANNHEWGWKRILNSIQVLRWLLAPPSGLAWRQTHELPWARTAQRGGSYIPDKQKLWNNVCCFRLLSFEAICDAATDKYNDNLRTYGCFTQYSFWSGNSLLSSKSINKVVPTECAGLARYDIPEKQQNWRFSYRASWDTTLWKVRALSYRMRATPGTRD